MSSLRLVWRVVVFPLLAASCLPAASSPPKPPDSYAVTQIAIGNVDNGHSLNSAGQVAGTSNGWAFLWTPVTPNGPVGNLVDTGGVPVQTYTAVAINDRGQVVGTTAVPAHAFLWSPETPNGTSGAVTAFLGSTAPDASYAVAINSFGQIAGGQGGAGFFWTPSTPNGATGTINPDSRLGGPHGINAINDFGQATLNYPATLFTPSVANGATGSFTPLSGLPGDRDAYLIAINRGGTILGVGCTNAGCDHGFLWTPTNANGTTGTAVEIPLPPGYMAMYPTALNAAGQVVGTIRTAESGSVPVLYSGGTVYDLSGLGGAPAAINDRGQILLHNGDQVFLATPGIASPAPSPGTIAITIAVAFNPPAGLINPQLSQLAYPPPFTVSGTGCSAGGYNTPQTLYWAPGSTCTVTFLSPQSMRIGTRSLFQSWQDGAATSTRIIVAPASATTYTAVFAPQYLVTAVANPPGGGTLSGGGWYTGRSTATLMATPSSGYRISDWSPPLVAAGSTSASVTVFAAQTIEVNFGPLTSVAPNYLVTQIASNATSRGINDFGQVVGYSSGLPNGAFLWTPVAANSPAGSMTNLGALPVGNSGATDINERGQVIGVTTQTNWFGDVFSSRPFLWSPDSANGISGTFVPFLGDPAFSFTSLVGINHYGQIAGNQKNGLGFLWTPSSPNGAIGTLQLDSHLTGVAGINDFGQAIVNAQPPALFTPSTPNSSTGSFVAIAGLPGNNPQFTAIDNHGTILGVSGGHIFVWTPTTPNGTSGTAAEILPLPGYVSMTPTAMNDAGQFVGTMPRADGVRFPFLYSGGTIYDLSTLGAQLKEMTPTGINDRGQIVGTNLGMAYLLTPGAAPPPPASGSVAVTITANVPLQTFTVGGSGCVSGGYVTPQTLYWTPGSSCTVTFVSPHSNSTGTRYVFAGWQGGVNANPRVFVAPAQAASYAATFSQQNLLVVKANPPEGGTVSGGGWYTAGSTATVIATPAAGYRFVEWVPPVFAVAGTTSATLTMDQQQSVTARFVPAAAVPPGDYRLTQMFSGLTFARPVKPINRFGQVAFSDYSSRVFLWTPVAPNSDSGNLTQIFGLPGTGDSPVGINDRGQVAGFTRMGTGGQPFLWSPNSPNSSTGSAVAFLGGSAADGSGAVDINSFGQILGRAGESGFLWTPSAANGTTGTTIRDDRFNMATAINDFGQAIMQDSALFTPSTANGSSGTFTTVAGLAGATTTQVHDINASGTILGSSCIPSGLAGQCNNHMFLWTPASPNGTAGTVAEIPVPAGFGSMFPAALNASGQIVGRMTQASGPAVPFLYTGGTVYDLSMLSNLVSGAGAVGINDRGQIVISSIGVYVLSPEASTAPAPAAVSASPASGNGAFQTMTFTFSDPRGWQDLDVVNILINNVLDGRKACYLAYSRPLNTLYLVNDDGAGLSQGLDLNAPGGIANRQCMVSATSGAAGSGNTLSLTLNVSFSPGFAGNKVVYMAARDMARNNSGWQASGTWGVPGAAAGPLAAVSAIPASGAGSSATLTFTFTDTKGSQDLGVVNILINSTLDGRHACYLAYSRPLQVLYLVNDAGTALLPALALGGSASVSNSQCAVYAAGSSVVATGSTLTLVVNLAFAAAFGGNHAIYLAARDNGDHDTSGWQPLGSWTVQ